MKTLVTVAVVPLFAGFLWAQATQTESQTTTTKTTTYNGTLIDAGCRTTHTEHRETSSNSQDVNGANRSETTTTTSESVDCPVTTTTTTFGLLTPDGKYVRFDDPSNTRVIEMVKGNKKWHAFVTEKKPLKVQVIGEPNGDTVVVKTIR